LLHLSMDDSYFGFLKEFPKKTLVLGNALRTR
jgi:hypothetical protein